VAKVLLEELQLAHSPALPRLVSTQQTSYILHKEKKKEKGKYARIREGSNQRVSKRPNGEDVRFDLHYSPHYVCLSAQLN